MDVCLQKYHGGVKNVSMKNKYFLIPKISCQQCFMWLAYCNVWHIRVSLVS